MRVVNQMFRRTRKLGLMKKPIVTPVPATGRRSELINIVDSDLGRRIVL
jgi:hypothetical protein